MLAAAMCLLAASAFGAQAEAISCVAPQTPITALPASVVAEYRAEIVTEFEAYFRDLSDFVACLDEERARALAEAHVATGTYATLLNTVSARKDLP